MNGTQRAIDLIRRDIIFCDWHYSKQVAEALIDYSLSLNERKMLGHLNTTWRAVNPEALHA
jgi:hypothetical protein